MTISTCKQHGIICAHLCPVCHKALCSACKTKDGCCSERCYQRRVRFPAPPVGTRGEAGTSLAGCLLKLALLTAMAAAAFYVAHRQGWIDLAL